ncbi:MAG: LysR family transcriptional regulator, partial [Sphingomonadaceae bacterium]|nr:LysR family transcriptional regulator [Sphingomonadaceae bacterium]
AAAGVGIALIPSFLIEPELAAGTLVSPFDLPLSRDDAYYLVYPETGGGEALARFRDWVVREAAS